MGRSCILTPRRGQSPLGSSTGLRSVHQACESASALTSQPPVRRTKPVAEPALLATNPATGSWTESTLLPGRSIEPGAAPLGGRLEVGWQKDAITFGSHRVPVGASC